MKVTNIKIKEGCFDFKKNDTDRCNGCPFFTSDDYLDEWGEYDGEWVGCALQRDSHIDLPPNNDIGAALREIYKGCPIISIEEDSDEVSD